MDTASRRAAYASIVLTIALWSSAAVVARGVLGTVAPVTLALLRWTVVVACLLPFVWRERRAMLHAARSDARGFAAFALVGFAPQTCLIYAGLAGSSATTLGLFNSAIPVAIVAALVLFRGRRLHAIEAVGLALSTIGVLAILSRGDVRALLALRFSPYDLLLLAGAAVWAAYTLKLANRPTTLSLQGFVFVAAVYGVAFIAPFAAAEIAWGGWPALDRATLTGILYLGTLPTLVAALLYGFGVARVGAVHAGILTHLMPVFTALLAAAFLGERLHPYHGAGFLLVAGGAILCCLRPSPVLTSRAPARAAADR